MSYRVYISSICVMATPFDTKRRSAVVYITHNNRATTGHTFLENNNLKSLTYCTRSNALIASIRVIYIYIYIYIYICDICCIVYTWRQIVLSDDFLVTLEHDVTRVVMTSHEY